MMETLHRVLAFFEAVGQVVAVILLVAVVAGCVWLALLGARSRRLTPRLSPTGGPLLAVGEAPNWVSTTARPRDVLHHLPARPCADNPLPALAEVLAGEGATVQARTERYLHAICRSRRFGFVDDVELLYDVKAGLLHGRSASRVGYSDLGVNRRRLEALLAAVRQDAPVAQVPENEPGRQVSPTSR
jgi:uncharacterized protein (DUF1499 family)